MPVLADLHRPDGRVLLDSADREIGRFEARRRDGRPLADLFTLARGVTPADAAAVVLADLRGWRVCCPEPLARRLIIAGGRPGRHSHAMSRDLLENPAPAAWLEPRDVDGFRLTSV